MGRACYACAGISSNSHGRCPTPGLHPATDWATCLSDVVLIMLGTNDASVLGRKVCSDRFVSDYSAIVAQYQQANGKQPRVILAMPPQYSDLKGVSGYSGSGSRHPGRDLEACPEDCRHNVPCYLACKVRTRAQMWPGRRSALLPRAHLYWRCMELPRIHTPSPTDTRVLIADPCDDAGGGDANGRDGSRAGGRDEQHGNDGGPTPTPRPDRAKLAAWAPQQILKL